jgi:hypothetical protein
MYCYVFVLFALQVLKRRLARAGGDASDAVALQQLLATFSDPMRLPPAVRGGKPSSSSSSAAAGGAHELEVSAAAAAAAENGSAGGSVAKGAMLVFERNGAGTVTARVSDKQLQSNCCLLSCLISSCQTSMEVPVQVAVWQRDRACV